ncbi:ethanolamine utilization protein EutN [Sodalis ligni]|jgi:carbon dioxide concentrating mechanism protein CcmL|uniref:Ethanolamine utilization protein EutN n=1 Tax=Sodalis ligni TaxID=2697027 RepID=A0A4V2Q3N7_9GAMM|nr:EutN/CcmL family microcompartment protein [Sodalis ligni]QWA09306.1 ethanolamine utilization protein EutN [Sodalis ligni]TCL07418.1 ethanolamine utilization protein EutN [Sodalis ligni]
MQLAKVIGSVVSTQKSASLLGKKLMVITWVNLDGSGPAQNEKLEEIAVDSVGAGVGELVLVTRGSSARKIFPEPNQAIDLAIVGIIDTIDRF